MAQLANKLQHKLRPPRQEPLSPVVPIPEFSPSFVRDIVFASDDIPEQSRVNSDYIHVSSLLDFCARRQVLSIRDNINLIRQPRGQDRVMWAMGKAAEHHVRMQLIKALNYSGVIGHWECRCGQVSYSGFYDHLRVCGRCKQPATTYQEFAVADEEYKIIGHPDLPFMADNALTILEIKSMNKEQFKELTEPLANHVFQAGCYQKMFARRGGVPVRETVVIFYVVKDYMYKGSPYKEYHIDVTNGHWPDTLDVAWKNAAIARDAHRLGTLPNRLAACPTHLTTIARNCAACVSCFSR